MFKKILLVLVALLVVFLVVVALQPSEYRVERSTTVAAAPSQVFGHVNDFHKWEAWSPWAKLDSDAKVIFVMSAPATGKMNLVESDPEQAVKIRVTFTRSFEGGTNSDFSFMPKGDQTEVAWAMHGTHNFTEKAFCLVWHRDDGQRHREGARPAEVRG